MTWESRLILHQSKRRKSNGGALKEELWKKKKKMKKGLVVDQTRDPSKVFLQNIVLLSSFSWNIGWMCFARMYRGPGSSWGGSGAKVDKTINEGPYYKDDCDGKSSYNSSMAGEITAHSYNCQKFYEYFLVGIQIRKMSHWETNFYRTNLVMLSTRLLNNQNE